LNNLTEEEKLIKILVNFVLENSNDMSSPNQYERCWKKLEEISEKALKIIHERLKNEV